MLQKYQCDSKLQIAYVISNDYVLQFKDLKK